MAVFLNVSCFVFEQSIVFQNIYNIFYFKTSSIFNSVKKQSGIGFVDDALFGYFIYLHSLYAAVELHINFVLIHFGRQPTHYAIFFSKLLCMLAFSTYNRKSMFSSSKV